MPRWKQTYWVVFAANLITAVGMLSFLPFFPAIVRRLGVESVEEQALWSGLLFGAAPLAAAIMGPIWGSLGDRYGRKLMVLRSLLGICLFVGCMTFARTPWELLFLRLGQGLFSGFIPPSITLVSVLTPRDLQGRVTGSLQAALPAGAILGPLVAVALEGRFGIQSVFVFVALASGLSALLVGLFAHDAGELERTLERFSPSSILAETRHDLVRLFADPAIRSAFVLLFAVQFGMGATNPQLQLFVEELWHGEPARATELTAWLFTLMALAGLVATPLWGRLGDRVGHSRALGGAVLASALVLGLHAALPGFALLVAARVLVGLTGPGTNVAAFGVVAMRTANAQRGGAFGAIFSARALAVSLGAMGGGALSTLLGLRGLFFAMGAAVLVVLLVCARWTGSALPDAGPGAAGSVD